MWDRCTLPTSTFIPMQNFGDHALEFMSMPSSCATVRNVLRVWGVVNPPVPFWRNVNPQGVNPLDDYIGSVVRGKLGTAILNHPAVTSGRSFGSQSEPVDSLKAFVVEGKLGKAISQTLSVARPKLTLERYQYSNFRNSEINDAKKLSDAKHNSGHPRSSGRGVAG